MKKIISILAALIVGAASFNATAQLKITGESEGGKQLATLNPMVSWLYLLRDNYYMVITTSNKYDPLIWLDLGDSPEVAIETLTALQDALHKAKRGDHLYIESREDKFLLTKDSMLGTQLWRISGVQTREPYAGYGIIEDLMFKKAIKTLQE